MGTVQHPQSVAMFDLLWKYYEKNRQYVAAAKILSKLSDKHRYNVS
jgi:nuclear pore complex protein Nup155